MKALLGAVALAMAGMTAVAGPAPSGKLFPFQVPWNDTGTGNITDLAAWNGKPAGAKGFVTVSNGHLGIGGERLKLLGVNITFGSNAPSHSDADIVARRLARFGVNIVRFHHMDTVAAPIGILQKDGVTLDPEYLERLDYFIAALKRNGIYADLNLHVGREYPGFGKTWPGGPSYWKGVDNFYPAMIALQKDFARDLLHHVNPYTGTRYADEPAVAIVEINNENGLVYQWGTGELDGMTEPFRSELQRRWQAWLKHRYGNDAALRAAWGAREEPMGAEMFVSGWSVQNIGTAKASLALSKTGVTVSLDAKGAEGWHTQLHQNKLRFDADRPYTLTLTLRADHAMTVDISAMQNHAPWKALWTAPVKVGTAWQTYRFTFAPPQGDDEARLSLGGLGFETGKLEIAEASLKPGGISGLTAGESLDRDTIAISDHATRFNRTVAAQRDWLAFLWDTEAVYWQEMQRYLKADLGVRSLIVGSQVSFSPADVQAGLDVVDGHAYWQHPSFPGRPWDPDNWRIKNSPMAGIEGAGTIAELALRRVPGKPFIVTEYNSPAPSFYQGEAMPLIAAYGALQDWDGIFLFDFGGWDNDWHTDHIQSFFDSRSNPVKMTSLIATAAMLRRGDVTAAKPVTTPVPDRAAWVEAARNHWGLPGGESFGTPPDVSLAKAVGATANGGPAPAWPVVSETGELSWGIGGVGGKTVVIDSAKSKGLIGARLGKPYDAHGVGIELTAARGDWGVVLATVIQGKDFASPGRILITTLGQEENTDQQWQNGEHHTVGRHWGQAPVLVEGVGAKLTLPVAAKRVSVWALDGTGYRKMSLPVTGKDKATVELGEGYQTLWYEIEIK